MYQSYLGIGERPFAMVPDERYLFMTEKHREALGHLVYAIEENGGFALLTGEVGTGKTLVSRRLLGSLPRDIEVALCVNPKLTDIELLAVICDELGLDYPRPATSRKDLVDRITHHLLRTYAEGRRVVLIIDEAQDLDHAVLEQVRLLTNLETGSHKLLQIILIGQPELLSMLKREHLRQVDQRITARYHLMPLTLEETAGYIRHRLRVVGLEREIFTEGAVDRIYRASQGVPRLINSICDRCLLGMYAAEERTVTRQIARAAAREVVGLPRRPRIAAWRGAARWVSAGVTAGLFLMAIPIGAGGGDGMSGLAAIGRAVAPLEAEIGALFGSDRAASPPVEAGGNPTAGPPPASETQARPARETAAATAGETAGQGRDHFFMSGIKPF